jgi:hypothetical protein
VVRRLTPHAPHTPRERIMTALTVGALLEIVWTFYLGWRLPRHYLVDHWDLAWVGLDVGEVAMLLSTAWAAWRRRAVLILFAVSSATLLVLDAWFDITTAGRGSIVASVVVAVCVEIPSAVALLLIARRGARIFLETHQGDHTFASVQLLKVSLASGRERTRERLN